MLPLCRERPFPGSRKMCQRHTFFSANWGFSTSVVKLARGGICRLPKPPSAPCFTSSPMQFRRYQVVMPGCPWSHVPVSGAKVPALAVVSRLGL